MPSSQKPGNDTSMAIATATGHLLFKVIGLSEFFRKYRGIFTYSGKTLTLEQRNMNGLRFECSATTSGC
jgi:hypothetical protein